jgi:hypothetical protein
MASKFKWKNNLSEQYIGFGRGPTQKVNKIISILVLKNSITTMSSFK